MDNILYKHKLIIGKGAYVEIEISHGESKLSITGGCHGVSWQCRDEIKEEFKKYPENLYISKPEFTELMDVWDNWHLKTISKDVIDFLKSVRNSPEIQKIEDNLDFKTQGPTDPLDVEQTPSTCFYVEVWGQAIFLDSSFKYTENHHNIFDIKFRIDDNDKMESYQYCDSFMNQGKTSLSRRDVLRAFECILTDAMLGSQDFEDFKADLGMEDKNDVKNREAYQVCKKATTQLKDVVDIEEMLDNFRVGEMSDYSGWIVGKEEEYDEREISNDEAEYWEDSRLKEMGF